MGKAILLCNSAHSQGKFLQTTLRRAQPFAETPVPRRGRREVASTAEAAAMVLVRARHTLEVRARRVRSARDRD